MRILIVSIYYRPEPVPKPHELAEGLARMGHRVTVLTAFPSYPEGRLYAGYALRPWKVELLNDVRVIRVPIYPDHSSRALGRIAHVMSFFLSALTLGNLFAGTADAVYVWGNPPTSGLAGWLLSRLRGARFVYGVHDLWPELAADSGMIHNRRAIRFIDALERFVVQRADVVFAISKGIAARLIDKGAAAVDVVPHWADGRIFRPEPRDNQLLDELDLRGCFVVLYAGNIGRLQGLDGLIAAASEIRNDQPDVRIVLLGEGVEKERLVTETRARALNNVVFLPRVPATDVPRYCGIADALYVGLTESSLARLSVPSKLATYFACGRPVISTVPGETEALIREQRVGITCEGTSTGIANGIRQLSRMTADDREEMGRLAYELFRAQFSMDRLIAVHDERISAVVRGVRTGRI
jgi:colanic acid biosynthesis glycosyl transferase WcaI